MQTVVELPEFLARARKVLTDQERSSIVNYLAYHPEAGRIMKGTGGVRKLRWAVHVRGKSGGVRVIYFFRNPKIPVFLLTVFAKGDKVNLKRGERNELARLSALIVRSYGAGQ